MVEATSLPSEETYSALIDLDRVLEEGGANRHDRVLLLIEECIRQGIDAGPLIISVLCKLGFKKQHVGLLLDDSKGANSESYRWYRDDGGRYRLHDSADC